MAAEVTNNEQRRRFEVTEDGHTAFLTYQRDGDTVVLVHTDVPDELEGRGLASALARAGLAFARTNDLVVVPECSFVRSYIERHPDEVADLTIDTSSLP